MIKSGNGKFISKNYNKILLKKSIQKKKVIKLLFIFIYINKENKMTSKSYEFYDIFKKSCAYEDGEGVCTKKLKHLKVKNKY